MPPTGSKLFSTGGRQETSVCVCLVFLTWVDVFSQNPELWVVLKSHQAALLDSIYLKETKDEAKKTTNRNETEAFANLDEYHSDSKADFIPCTHPPPPLAYTYSFYISEIQKSIAPSSQHVVSFAHSPHPGDRGESGAAAKFHLSAGNFAAIADREVYVSCISDRWISGYAPPPPPTHAHTLTSLDNNDTL